MYPPAASDPQRGDLQYQAFPAKVLTVDYERKVCTIQDLRTGTPYQEVNVFPANSSAFESSDINMPEIGSTCVAVPIWWRGGFMQVAIISWQFADASRAQDAIAVRPVEGVDGLSTRKRGSYRKAYPGQKTVTTTEGFTEKVAGDWDRSGKDLSRDHLNADRRTWTQITGRRVEYSDAGIIFKGAVNRPKADNIIPRILPDGSSEYVLFLEPGAQESDRYIGGKQDVIAWSENTQRVQEFALDYPLPQEILETDLLNDVLGSTEDPWQRTVVITNQGPVSFDDETFLANQTWDHPYIRGAQTVGPTTSEGATPRRRGFIIEKTEGTLVGYNLFDAFTYGQVLKPTVFPYTHNGRFGADVNSGYLPVVDSPDHAEARLAASTYAMRFPHEYNTTRFDITKEGFMSLEIGSTLPEENIPLNGGYEHPHGAGRSLEAHLVGSMKMVIGKNRDEEEALDFTALGQVVMRIGADDTSLPNARRTVLTQTRSKNDTLQTRSLQYWSKSKLKPGDAGDLVNKTGAENTSIRMATDGAIVGRFGSRNPAALRRHLINGYQDAPGKQQYSVTDPGRVDSHSPGRPTYPAGDSNYAFHDLTQAGKPVTQTLPYAWSGSPVPTSMDRQGLSVDFHTVRDILIRAGANTDNNQSLLMDLAGGLVAWIGADKQGRSITASLDGGVEMHIGANAAGKGLRLEIIGDIDITHIGNLHWHSTGDWVTECSSWRHITKTDQIFTAQKIIEIALARHTTEAADIVHNQGLYSSDENS